MNGTDYHQNHRSAPIVLCGLDGKAGFTPLHIRLTGARSARFLVKGMLWSFTNVQHMTSALSKCRHWLWVDGSIPVACRFGAFTGKYDTCVEVFEL